MMNMANSDLTRYGLLMLIARLTCVAAFGFFSMRWILTQYDSTRSNKQRAKKKAKEQLRKLADSDRCPRSFNMDQLTEYEMIIANHLIDPNDIKVSWNNIAGLDNIIRELKETVILPIQRTELFEDSQLTQAPKGVLLYGPPGCGKTMIAKATAREAKTCFINLDVSILTDKWYGESQKLAAAVFSLAVKLQPCIIFIDEIDSFLRWRNLQDHEATAMMKAQFMSLWDGLITDPDCTVIIMGATNRPQDLDKAILRRMPATFHIGLPNEQQRLKVLQLILKNEPTANDVEISSLARLTEDFSGSDLRELCRNASTYRIRDYISSQSEGKFEDNADNECGEEFHDTVRPITMEDLIKSFKKMRTSKLHIGTLNTRQLELD